MWSPWRSEHINNNDDDIDQDTSSIFVQLASQDSDKENLILWRGQFVFVIMNLYPYNSGHLMVVPYREVANYEDLSADEQVEIARTIERCIHWIRHAMAPDGFNVGMNLGKAAGAGIPRHLHVHVVPRWNGDTNFMPVQGNVKVIPEALEKTYAKLKLSVDTLGDMV